MEVHREVVLYPGSPLGTGVCCYLVLPVVIFSFVEWMYPSGGGEENVESAALGIIILWTTW